MNDTPQTDAQPIQFVRVADVNGTERMEPYVPAEAMRRIERAYFQICCGWADMEVALHEAKRERDEALTEVARLKTEVSEYEAVRHRQAVELLRVKNESVTRQENHSLNVQLTIALKERDEAREALQSVMDWNPKPEYWERPETVGRFEADMARAREVLEATK